MRTLMLLLCLLVLFQPSYSQFCPPNLDFETGTFDNWDCFTGTAKVVNGKNSISLTPSGPTGGRHEIISSTTAKDPFGNFPQLCPYGGSYSIKLGNSSTGAQAEGLSYTFQVPPTVDTFSFTYFYAVVFEDPMHTTEEQPRFFVTAYDVVSGALISCASYDYISTGGIPGFKASTVRADVLYKEWSPVSIQFAGLANRTVRLEFKTADCTLGGHFGYAYVDVSSRCSNILATAPYCIETNSIVLNAPYGFQSYTWYNQDYSAVIGNQQSVTLSPPPATSGYFHVDIVPYPGYGCRDTAQALVVPLPVPVQPEADTVYQYCQYQAARALTATSLPGNDILWYATASGGTGSATAPVPSTARPGVYTFYVVQKVLFGCESLRKKITVTISPTPAASFLVNKDRQCEKDNRFLFTSTSSNLDSAVYTWAYGDGQTATSPDSTANYSYKVYGTYAFTLKVQNAYGCSAQKAGTVTVYPNPVAGFTFPPLICEKETAVLLKDNSTIGGGLSRISGWSWNINGNISTAQNPASFIAGTPGGLPVKLSVVSNQGCTSDTNAMNLSVRYRPDAAFGYSSPLCNNEIISFTNLSALPSAAAPEFIGKWYWQFGNNVSSSLKDVSLNLAAGANHVKLLVESNYGCRSTTADSVLTIYPKPAIQLAINDSCVRRTIVYTAIDSFTTVNKWNWNFGTGFKEGAPVMSRYYNTDGYRPLTLIGQTVYGCRDTVIRPFTIFENKSFAGRDTLAAMNEPVQLNAHGGQNVQYNWTPPDGLNNAAIENPVALGANNQQYRLDALSKEGCDSHSQIKITRYKGPDIYIPNAFTPNGDGNNDELRVLPVGIRKFNYLAVYNRWGELLYRTTDYRLGWDGTYRGRIMEPGIFVAIAQAVDYNGKEMNRKSTVMLVR